MALDEEDKRWINERLEAVDTRLLTAFHEWASPMEARVKSHTAVLHALDVEHEAMSERLKRLEGK